MHRYRTHTCGALRDADIGTEVRLSGWCHRIRDHGGVLFIDLRDHYGLTQVVADPDSPAFKLAETLRSEWVVRIDGKVRARPPGTVNPELPTGAVEVYIRDIEVLGPAGELPMPVAGEQDYPEEIRLKYRFLDLRRDKLHQNIMTRGQVIDSIRRRMKEQGFFEFQTPILTASSPEGARDYLVPSRLHPGKFYALPQAPQQFKQLTMVAGFDRYFQIAPCFRDEDARADRSPGEFYQLDLEMSFVTQQDVFEAVEPVMHGLFREFAGNRQITELDPDQPRIPIRLADGTVENVLRFKRLSYSHAMRTYGTDKPDLRNPLEFENVTNHFRGSDFRVFADQIAADPRAEVWAVNAPEAGSRAFCDRMNAWAQSEGQPGLGYMIIRDGRGIGPIANRIGLDRTAAIQQQMMPAEGNAVFFICGIPARFSAFASLARQKIARELGLIRDNEFAFCWIVDFPMFEWNEEEKKVDFSHNPFSMPQCDLNTLDLALRKEINPLEILAFQYDIVCNGTELSSGAIRNHRPDVMRKAFAIAGYGDEVLEQKFGGMLRALSLGAPPHGGIAPGIDRIVMLLCGEENLREVVLFPMNQKAEDLMMGAPSEVAPKQLRELHIRSAVPQQADPIRTEAPMDTMLLRTFQVQIEMQCKYLLRAAAELNSSLQKHDIEGMFYAVQNILNAGANISKAFWGQGGRLERERKALRDSVGVDDASPLREVTMRNNFEHFDERLDQWWTRSKRKNYIDYNIGPKSMTSGADDIDMFRMFDPQTTDVTFWGQSFNLQRLTTEVERILPRLQAEANKPHWETDSQRR